MPEQRVFPPEKDLEALFDQLNGVDFAKGCYIGQEVVSRMEHRGTARKRIVPVEGVSALPAFGTSIEADGIPIGTLGSVSGAAGLALIRLDRAEEALAQAKTLTAVGVKIALRRPAFARFAGFDGRDAFAEALKHGSSGIGTITQFDTGPYPCKIAGEVKGLPLDAGSCFHCQIEPNDAARLMLEGPDHPQFDELQDRQEGHDQLRLP